MSLHHVFAAALLVAAFGCKRTGGDCARAIDHSMELSKPDMTKQGMDEHMLENMKDVALQRCREDKWPGDVLECMQDAKTESDGQACYGKLTPEQQQKMNKQAMEAMTPPGGNPGGGSAGGAPAAGTGSAPAGSAAAN